MLGVWLGESEVLLARVDAKRITHRETHPVTQRARPDQLLDQMAELVRQLDPQVKALGVALPGEIDIEGRVWGLAYVTGFDGAYVGQELAMRLGCPVVTESDGTCAALGEASYGSTLERSSCLLVMLDGRMASGLVLDRKLYRGACGFAGQLAHLPVRQGSEARECSCGRRGCLLAHANARALVESYRAQGGRASSRARIIERAQEGEPIAERVIAELGRDLGSAIGHVQNVLDVDAVVLLANVGEFALLAPTLREQLRSVVFAEPSSEASLLEAELSWDAVVVGAAKLATDELGAL